jgi:hypothetical protein
LYNSYCELFSELLICMLNLKLFVSVPLLFIGMFVMFLSV